MLLQDTLTDDIAKGLYSSALDALDDNIAIIDRQGPVLAVNSAWQTFADENGLKDEQCGVGSNYFRVCVSAGLDPSAQFALNGLKQVAADSIKKFKMSYACNSPWQKREFDLSASALDGFPGLVLISHHLAKVQNVAPVERGSTAMVCAWCESFRHTDAQGLVHWLSRSEALNIISNISHGICPTCQAEQMKAALPPHEGN